MRVLHVQRAKGIGGSERHLLTLLPALAAAGVEVRMCVIEVGEGDRFVAELRAAGVDVGVHRSRRDIDPTLVPGLVGEIRRFRPDIVHSHLVHADVYGQIAAAAARVAGVSSVHGTPAFYLRQPYRSVGMMVSRLAKRRIAISDHVAAFLHSARLAPTQRIRVVHYGIDVRSLTVDEAERARIRAAMAVESGDFALGIASRLIPGKGHDVLIHAVAKAAPRLGHLKLFVAGDGPERPKLEALAARLCPTDTVHFLGFIEDIRSFMAACDALAFPTLPELSEGFGLAALEAMAAGRPVVASNVGSLPEVIDDGTTGFLVTAGSVDSLEAVIRALAIDRALCRRLGANGMVRARTMFPLESMVSRTMAVYEEVA
jgi:glycosyltransferase involved in cell wall biosynthesis